MFMQERWTKFSAVIGYTSGQDEPNPALWLATHAGEVELTRPLRTLENLLRKPYNWSLIDQAC